MKTSLILNERPEGMSMDEYRYIRKAQQKEIKKYLKGDFVFKSKNTLNKDKEGKLIKGLTAIKVEPKK